MARMGKGRVQRAEHKEPEGKRVGKGKEKRIAGKEVKAAAPARATGITLCHRCKEPIGVKSGIVSCPKCHWIMSI